MPLEGFLIFRYCERGIECDELRSLLMKDMSFSLFVDYYLQNAIRLIEIYFTENHRLLQANTHLGL